MRNFLIAASLALVTTSGFAAKLSCEAATAELSFLKSSLNKGEVESVISVSREGRSTILRYDGGIDFIGMECRKTKSGRAMLVFQAYCAGSACRDNDNFGIIDPTDLRVRLIPSDNNRKLAQQILGTVPTQIKDIESISVIGERLFSK